MAKFAKSARLLLGASLAVMVAPGVASAQTATAPSAAPQEEQQSATTPNDIIVTANKKEERVQDVALAITAVSGDELNERRLVDVQDLAQRVPGFNFQRGSSQGPGQRIILRGLNTGSTNATVASVLDDTPLTASAASSAGGDFAADFDPYDLSRVEVLKGPQGTLYGATSLGGLVKYVTNAPDPTKIEGGFDVGLSNLLHGSTGAFAKGFINLPVVPDVAALRFSGFYETQPGWINNPLGGATRINNVRRYGGRASFIIKPTDALTERATAVIQDRVSGGYDIVEVNGYTSATNPFGLLNGYSRNTYIAEPNTAHSEVYSNNLEYDFGGVRLQSITSFGKLRTTYDFDTPLYQPLSALFFGRANTTLVSGSFNTVRKLSQELRIASDNDAATTGHGLEWQVGGFYTRERTSLQNDYLTRDATTKQTVITPASIAATPPGTPQVFLARIKTRYQEYAGYVDLTYHFSPTFDIEAGGRVFHNSQNFTQTTGGALFAPAAFQTVGPFFSNETRATFAVAPRIHFNRDLLLYGRVSSGYRPGGPNLAIPPAGPAPDTPGTFPTTFGSDTTTNYEAGLKGGLFNNRFFFDVSGFFIDWNNIQVVQTIRRGFTGYSATLNAGKATSKGVEWNFNLQPMRRLSFGWLGAYTDATLSSDVTQLGGAKGSQLPFVPRFQSTVTADLNIPVSDGFEFTVGGSYSYTGPRRTNYGFDPTRSYLRIPGYSVVNAQAGVRFDNITVQVYGKNLGDTFGITNYDRGNLIFGVSLPGSAGVIRPRELGLRVSGRF